MAVMSRLPSCPAAWVDHLLLRILAQYNLLASWFRSSILLALPLKSPMLSMALLRTHLGAAGLSVQLGSDWRQAWGGWLPPFYSKAVRCRISNLLRCVCIRLGSSSRRDDVMSAWLVLPGPHLCCPQQPCQTDPQS